MTSRDFCFWLQGLFEIGKAEKLDADQVKIVKEHLGWVFEHEIGNQPAKDPAKKVDMGKVMTGLRVGRTTMIC